MSSSLAFREVPKGAFGGLSQRPTLSEILKSDELSRALLEAVRWPQGPVCPSCHAVDAACKLKTRPGLWTCKACRHCQYSVTSGTPLHGTRVNMMAWVVLFHTQEVRGQRLSISQVSHKLGVSYLTAKSMLQRLDQLRTGMPDMAERFRGQLSELAAARMIASP